MLRNIAIGMLLILSGYLLFLQFQSVNPHFVAADFVLPDGSQYFGESENGMFHGEGKLLWQNGDRVEGQFAQGMLNGKAEFWGVNGSHYIGEYKNGLFDGLGTLSYQNGSVYEGEFKQGNPHGKGKLSFEDGGVYEGEFAIARFSGEGKYTAAMGTYEGQFANDKIVQGKFEDVTGNHYEGGFKDWMFEGEGRYETEEGVFSGNFVQGELSGPGRYKGSDGTTYEGEFESYYYSGNGKLRRANGSAYEGEFYYGQYHGQGTLTLAEEVKGFKELSGEWEYGSLKNDPRHVEEDFSPQVESALYSQKDLLAASQAKVQAGLAGVSELFFMGVAGFSRQDVFLKEINYLRELFSSSEYADNRILTLVNNHKTIAETPLATNTSLSYAIKAIEEKMNVEEDVLFLYLTSHGSKSHELSIQVNGMSLPDVSVDHLANVLNNSKIQYKVIFISACYSGGFIPSLENDNTLVISAARGDRKSFGCSDASDMTYFAKAYFVEALPKCGDFISSFYEAEKVVYQWENEDFPSLQHSLPQMSVGSNIEGKLLPWKKAGQTECKKDHSLGEKSIWQSVFKPMLDETLNFLKNTEQAPLPETEENNE